MPCALIEWLAVVDFYDSAGVGADEFDFVFEVDAPEAGFALVDAGWVSFFVEFPHAGFEGEVVFAVVGEGDLLAECVLSVFCGVGLAFAAPDADEREEREESVVEVGAFAEVSGVVRDRKVTEAWDVAVSGALGLFGSEVYCVGSADACRIGQ